MALIKVPSVKRLGGLVLASLTLILDTLGVSPSLSEGKIALVVSLSVSYSSCFLFLAIITLNPGETISLPDPLNSSSAIPMVYSTLFHFSGGINWIKYLIAINS